MGRSGSSAAAIEQLHALLSDYLLSPIPSSWHDPCILALPYIHAAAPVGPARLVLVGTLECVDGRQEAEPG